MPAGKDSGIKTYVVKQYFSVGAVYVKFANPHECLPPNIVFHEKVSARTNFRQ